MSNDLDLRGIDQRHEPNPQFRAALRERVAAIVDGVDPGVVTESRDLVTVDLEPTSAPSAPSRNRRLVAQVMLAAAAVVAIALVASRDDGATPADQPSPSVTSAPTVAPQSLFGASPHPETLEPGTYFADGLVPFATSRIFVTVGAGWTYGTDDVRYPLTLNLWKTGGVGVGNQVGFIGFSRPGDDVFADACHPSEGYTPADVATVDGLVNALTAQAGWADVTLPSDISVDGYVGKTFQRTAPTDMSGCDIAGPGGLRDGSFGMHPEFRSWEESGPLEPGQIETVWVLDVDGTVVVINTTPYSETSEADRAELVAALDSIRIASGPDDATPADQPLPTVPSTVPARVMPNTPDGLLAPGTYYVDEVDRTSTPRISGTLDSGWYDLDNRPGWSNIAKGRWPDVIGDVTFSNPVAVYADSCHPTEGFYPGSVTTVDGFVTALMEQKGGWVDVTVASGISIDGYVGKAFQRTAPAAMSGCTDSQGLPGEGPGKCASLEPCSVSARFLDWKTADGISMGHEPGQIETLWVLDIDGTVVVIRTELWPGPSATAHADFADALLDSIRIDRP